MKEIDLPGIAIADFYHKNIKHRLYVKDDFGPKVEMPLHLYFRNWAEMPILERRALDLCRGRILDVGAGAGAHTLELQLRKMDATALEISPAACGVMEKRGVNNVVCADIFKFSGGQFDTILLLMNGIGLCGTLQRLGRFFSIAKNMLREGGQLIFDSCDIRYMYDGGALPDHYYGEVRCRYEYAGLKTEPFKWLYIDHLTLADIASEYSLHCEIIAEDDNDQYLAKLTSHI